MEKYVTKEITRYPRTSAEKAVSGNLRTYLTLPDGLQRLFTDRNAREQGYEAFSVPIGFMGRRVRIDASEVPKGAEGFVAAYDDKSRSVITRFYRKKE